MAWYLYPPMFALGWMLGDWIKYGIDRYFERKA